MDCEIASALEIAWMLEGKEEEKKTLQVAVSKICGLREDKW